MLNSPVFDIEENNKNTGRIIPIYPLTYNLSQNTLRKIMESAIEEVYGKLEETLPQYLLKEYNLENLNEATKHIHFPDEFKDFNIARNRLVFEELLSVQLALLELKNNYITEEKGIQFDKNVKMSDVINMLPFKLTKAQLRVLEEIDNDMESNNAMNRLLQGDVGSGKTVVAMIAAYKAVKSGYQSALYKRLAFYHFLSEPAMFPVFFFCLRRINVSSISGILRTWSARKYTALDQERLQYMSSPSFSTGQYPRLCHCFSVAIWAFSSSDNSL